MSPVSYTINIETNSSMIHVRSGRAPLDPTSSGPKKTRVVDYRPKIHLEEIFLRRRRNVKM
eukprot:8675523-Pyramimonas_sp.AAC.1